MYLSQCKTLAPDSHVCTTVGVGETIAKMHAGLLISDPDLPSNFASEDLTTPTEVVGALLGVREHKFPYYKLHQQHLQPCNGYSAGQLIQVSIPAQVSIWLWVSYQMAKTTKWCIQYCASQLKAPVDHPPCSGSQTLWWLELDTLEFWRVLLTPA